MMKTNFLLAPVLWIVCVAALLTVWYAVDPATVIACFDAGGRSPVEIATLPVFAAVVPLVWWKCPFSGSAVRRRTLCAAVTVVAVMAIVKETDLHNLVLHWFYPAFVGEDGKLVAGVLVKPNGNPLTGTPFKMRVLTNAAVPFGMKALVIGYFASFFGVFAAGFAYLFRNWILGVIRLVPSAWAVGCMGASGLMVQISDRLPAWFGHAHGLAKDAGAVTSAQSLCTAIEEGGELMLALFALVAIWLGNRECRQDAGRKE